MNLKNKRNDIEAKVPILFAALSTTQKRENMIEYTEKGITFITNPTCSLRSRV